MKFKGKGTRGILAKFNLRTDSSVTTLNYTVRYDKRNDKINIKGKDSVYGKWKCRVLITLTDPLN